MQLFAVTLFCVAAAVATHPKGQFCDNSASRTDCGYVGVTQDQCEGKGCCWNPKDGEPWCFYKIQSNGSCAAFAPRQDCGFVGITEQECQTKGCCWYPLGHDPWCFYPTASFPTYRVTGVNKTALGVQLTLESTDKTLYGPNISPLVADIAMETNERLHVRIYDPNNKRWEVPESVTPIPTPPSSKPTNPIYKYSTAAVGEEFWVAVSRSSGEVIFNTSQTSMFSGMQFSDQYLEISTVLPNNPNLYGLGEHIKDSFKLPLNDMYTLWTADIGTPHELNLYGSHPFYLELRQPGQAHGVFLRNSNGMDILLGSSSLTYRIIGGILDFYFLLGPQPEAVIQQYQEVIGRPHMPPYWGLGFHNCRYGYPNVQTLEQVVANYSAAKIPLETMWTDIDYMDQYKDFTLDPQNFPAQAMNQFVQTLHNNGQQYVVIVDPGIKQESGYPAWDDGVKEDVFLKDKNGNIFIGKVWPGLTAFPDFLNPKAAGYWQEEIGNFLKLLPVDGLWFDMNEISNFCNGACSSDGRGRGRVGFDPDNPPYQINNMGGKAPLNSKTTDMDCQHSGGVLEYNAHNFFGLLEVQAGSRALEAIQKKRSFVITRSTFPGSGLYTGHWTGDNTATWSDLASSIQGMLNFQLFAIPLIGSDICGFNGETTEELCSRWIEVGAFYPFSRVHNTKGVPPQELYRWASVAAISRKVLAIRYSLLSYYYTLFYKTHRSVVAGVTPSATVVRPLLFEFPSDSATYGIDQQFMVGSAILVSPVVKEGATSVTAYFPEGVWYDLYLLTPVTKTGKTSIELSAPLDTIPVHYRGGSVIPMQTPANTTTVTRATNFTLLVALDNSGSASGDLYVDDGISLQPTQWLYIEYKVEGSKLASTVSGPGYSCPPLNTLLVLGVQGQPTKATVNGRPVTNFSFDKTTQVLTLEGLDAAIGKPLTITWS